MVSYIHHNRQVGVLVELDCETDFVARIEAFKELAREVALHIASADPIAVRPKTSPPTCSSANGVSPRSRWPRKGSPRTSARKIVEGKIKKFLAERTLLDQPWVKDDKKTIGDLVTEASGKLGEAITVRRFTRFKVGEA